MTTMSATEVENIIGELWDLAANEPVIIERNGTPRFILMPADSYVAVPRAEYDRLSRGADRPPRQIGFAKELLKVVDVDALLAVDLTDAMREYR